VLEEKDIVLEKKENEASLTDYQIIKTIGSGTFGSVKLVKQKKK
jgi:serine/threonine protein kinase